MQTFLPHASYTLSALRLDKLRKNKQITECWQILNTLLNGGGWSHHPAVKMWAGFEHALCWYAEEIYASFIRHGGKVGHKSWLKISTLMVNNGWDRLKPIYPPWLGDEKFHSSHRGRLLHKGNLDILRFRIRKHITKNVDEYCRRWLQCKLKDMNVEQCMAFHKKLDNEKIPQYINWYDQFGWQEQPSDIYVWPKSVKLSVQE